jgi:hypothetical protein
MPSISSTFSLEVHGVLQPQCHHLSRSAEQVVSEESSLIEYRCLVRLGGASSLHSYSNANSYNSLLKGVG